LESHVGRGPSFPTEPTPAYLNAARVVTETLYVSSSSGSDSNPGTLAAPLQTLAAVSARGSRIPGDRILLKAGDTWTESFSPPSIRSGFDETTFLGTYNSTLASRQTFWLASSEYTNTQAKALADGQDATTAAATAAERCRRLAWRDAMVAARDAADASSNWVRMEAYGSGANPAIDGGGTLTTGITIPDENGWRLLNIDVKNFTKFGIRVEVFGKGFLAEGCNISGITGSAVIYPPVGVFCPVGLVASNTIYNFTKNCTISSCGSPRWSTSCSYVFDDNPTCSVSNCESGYYQFCSKVLIRGGRITEMCQLPGYPLGGAGWLLSNVTDVFFEGVEIDHTHQSPDDGSPNHGDGVAVDFEDGVTNASFENCNFHDNAAPAFLFSRSGGHPNSGTMIVGCAITNNGTYGPSAKPAFVHNLLDSVGDIALFWNNTVHRAAAGQKLFALGGPPGQQTDTPPSHWLYGTDNIVSFP
jgi:hypothetical protein